jgi:hypothetical protein
MRPDTGETRVTIILDQVDRNNLAECMAKVAMARDGVSITVSNVVREALRRWASEKAAK